jgi:diaminohydroxyphosphoribosylaminopyrimidine deaminase/5-amino-6-(5-phosphoribosylamino)uracil reductase
MRVVLGEAPPDAAINPCLEMSGDLASILDDLGQRMIVQLMVEGGSAVAGEFHRAGLVDSYVIYLAPAFMGGDDGTPLLSGQGASTITDLSRGVIVDHQMVGSDMRITVEAG